MWWDLHEDKISEKEERLRRILNKRHSDIKRTTEKNVDYPHTCTTCGCSAFITIQPHCTNVNCKWYDRENLAQPLLDENPAFDKHGFYA